MPHKGGMNESLRSKMRKMRRLSCESFRRELDVLVIRSQSLRHVGFTLARSLVHITGARLAESRMPPRKIAVPGGEAPNAICSFKNLAMLRQESGEMLKFVAAGEHRSW